MATIKANKDKARFVSNPINQDVADGDWVDHEVITKYKLPEIVVDASTTTTSLESATEITTGDKLKVLDGASMVERTAGTVTTAEYGPFIGEPVEYDYFNKYHKHNIAKDTTVSDIASWTTGTNLPGALGYTQAIVTKSRVYLLGGLNDSGYVSTVYTAPINADGTLGTWTTGTSLPGALAYTQAIVTKSRVYLLGGYNGSANLSTVYTAPINEDGTLGTWATSTNLPGVLSISQAIVTKSRVYLLGGSNGGYVSTVYTAPINTDGTLGTWTTSTSLPGVLAYTQAIVTKSRVYLLGGNNGAYTSIVYTAPINIDGTLGTWATSTSLPGALIVSQAIVTKSRVYLLGGHNGAWASTVYTAPFSDGWEITDNSYEALATKYQAPITATTNIPTKAFFNKTIDTTLSAEATGKCKSSTITQIGVL